VSPEVSAKPSIPPSASAAEHAHEAVETTTGWARLENWLVGLADRANPILVKETRQALKSRQFVVTFLVVLVACWIASFGVVASIGPQIRYAAAGGELLIWYYAILSGALSVIVPFTAFRSLAAEQEENTYDLLSITTLSSRQIVSGKLWSAGAQMLIYLSAVTPFIGFTFLLRGVEVISVALLIVTAVLGSLGLSLVGLLLGTVAKLRHTQALVSVALVLLLVVCFWGSVELAREVLSSSSTYLRQPTFWIWNLAWLTLYGTTCALVHEAAAAQIAFASENRSTPLRRRMLLQQACFLGGLAIPFALARDPRTLYPYLMDAILLAAAYWYLMGTLMTGEWPHLSRRVQRSLPQSALGRVALTWFNPGPGTGYLFAVANLTAVALLALGALAWIEASSQATAPTGGIRTAYHLILLSWAYVVAFLGFGRVLIITLRRVTYVPMAAAFLLHLILVLTGVGGPIVINAMTPGNQFSGGYTLEHMSNPAWTLAEVYDGGASRTEREVLILVIPALAVAALLLNIRSVATEIHRQRIELPSRVALEEARLHPPPVKGPTNPWDAEQAQG
jgi:hypothetical protein